MNGRMEGDTKGNSRTGNNMALGITSNKIKR